MVPVWYHACMAMNLRLSPEQTEGLRRTAKEKGVSMQEAALSAIDAYISHRGERLKEAINKVASEDAELLDRLSK